MFGPQPGDYTPGPGFPSFSIPQSFTGHRPISTTSQPPKPIPSGSAPRPSFLAPAHKHAHHLHSIPPREKSTRMLIIDHMLWVHGRTRFAQARAELGMTDRTGGPLSFNFVHRSRPENYDEEKDENSEGEDVVKLKARAGDPNQHPGGDEDNRMNSQDLTLARSLRLRAEGLEKVITSMLGQPLAFHPTHEGGTRTPPHMNPTSHSHHHLHALPNGVRLRLALGALINDLFARQAPRPPFRHQVHVKSPSEQSTSLGSQFLNSSSELPVALASLYTVCAANPIPQDSISLPSSSSRNSPRSTRNFRMPVPSSRTRSLYNSGADPNTANSPPAFRCPRHLHTGCEICVQAAAAVRQGAGSRHRASSFVGYRTGQYNVWKGMPGGVGPGGGGITGWQDGSGIGSGLLKPGVNGNCLRRKVSGVDDVTSSTGSGNTKLSELIPRFIRLSALVAVELAMEALEETSTSFSQDTNQFSQDWAQPQDPGAAFSLPGPVSHTAQSGDKEPALHPTREWYLLLAGLLTRAALEGYLTASWRGSRAVECLLTVGLGLGDGEPEEKKSDARRFEEFEPDDMPTLLEATRLLFPSSQSSQRKAQSEEEFEMEMHERLRRFFDIPASTPDLSTHMEDLAWQYPAEPVERAAVRFCEAISKWRGKPELETYKKPAQLPIFGYAQDPLGSLSLPMESLVHSNPPTPTMANATTSARVRRLRRKPSIGDYFTQPPPPPFRDSNWSPNKRRRSPDPQSMYGGSPSKRLNSG